MSELLLEVYSAEIPAIMQIQAEQAYRAIFSKILKDNGLPYDEVNTFIGPHRLVLHVKGLPKVIPAQQLEVKGPPVTAPKHTIIGFCNSHNVAEQDLFVMQISEQSFYFYRKMLPKKNVSVLLAEIIPVALAEYSWPKSMRWGDYSLQWVRPIERILCLFDAMIVPMQFGHFTADNKTVGHRFIEPKILEVNSWLDYTKQLEQHHVIVEREERKKLIIKQLTEVSCSKGFTVQIDEQLLDEVTAMVEYPIVICGKIDERFLDLPQEVLITAMKIHQKYFAVFDERGKIAPWFLFVSNVLPIHISKVAAGNERVLTARFEDALYFYKQDLRHSLELKLTDLKSIVFHAKLGSLYDKMCRVSYICEYLFPGNKALQIAARLCKVDLVSAMVKEFPELQGVMGYYYAMHEQYEKQIAIAIRDHYNPQRIADEVPQGVAAMLALSDKIDSLIMLVIVEGPPTSSKDPYALRRSAISIIKIILKK